ncbi:MAG: hypothetical protein GY835_15630 [bacterium]|nr:hypothetical protein [bacterium]
MRRAVPSLFLLLMIVCALAVPGEVSATTEEPLTVYNIQGVNFSSRKQGNLRIMTLTNAVIISDSLRIDADRAEQHDNEQAGTLKFYLHGNVRIVEGTTTITGDDGMIDRELEIASVVGNARIVDGDVEIFCEEAAYNRRTLDIVLSGNVIILQKSNRIEAQRIIFNRETKCAEAFLDVAVHDLEAKSILRGQHGTFDHLTEEAVMDDDPSLMSVEAAGDTVTVIARTMRQRRNEGLSIAVGDVHYSRGNTEAFCDSAAYFHDLDFLAVFGKPEVTQGDTRLTGDNIEMSFDGKELRTMTIDGGARFQDEPADPRVFPGLFSEISGDRFQIEFEDGDIRKVNVSGKPRSLYIPEVTSRASINEAFGDSMILSFASGDLEEVMIFGEAQGTYRYLDDWEAAMAGREPVAADSLPTTPPAAATVPETPSEQIGVAGFSDLALQIAYKSRDIVYNAREERVYLERMAEVENEDFTLMAQFIRFDARDDFLDARGEPVLVDKDDKLYGEMMEYSIPDKAGLVFEGVTRYGEGFYSGAKLKKLGKDTINVGHSMYTTCDLEHPHYHFKIDRIQVQTQDKMVGAPVRFYLGKIPLFYLPFLFNNLERGRRSGFIQPDLEFGISTGSGHPQRFVRDVGYYWAINDYADLQTRFDFVEQRSLYGAVSLRYYQRYFMSGSLRNNLSWSTTKDLNSDSRSWGLQGSHQQNFGDHTRLNANVDYASSSSMRDDINHYSVQEVIDQRLTSNVSLTRRWNNCSVSTSYSRTQLLNQDENEEDDDLLLTERIPFNISTTSIPLWPHGVGKGGIQGQLAKIKLQPRISYNQTRSTYEDRKVISESASTGSSMGFNWKLGFVQVQPSVSASESWTRSTAMESNSVVVPFGKFDQLDSTTPVSPLGETGLYFSELIESEVGSEWSHNWSAQANASTKFYGIFYPRIGTLTGMRHTIAPRVGWRYSESRGQRFSLSRTMSMSVSNTLDLKFGEDDKVRRKSGVVSWNLGTNYNMEKKPDEDPWGSLSSSLRLSPHPGVSMSMNYSHDLNNAKKISSSINGSLRLAGRFNYGRIEKVDRAQNVVTANEDGQKGNDGEDEDPLAEDLDDDDDFYPFGDDDGVWGDEGRSGRGDGKAQSWNLGVSFSLNQTSNTNPSPSLALGGSINLTDNWKVDYRTSLNLNDGQLNGQTLNLTRDLHCWEATFSRLVINGVEQYYFRIYLKAHPDDIKIESGDRSAGYGYR